MVRPSHSSRQIPDNQALSSGRTGGGLAPRGTIAGTDATGPVGRDDGKRREGTTSHARADATAGLDGGRDGGGGGHARRVLLRAAQAGRDGVGVPRRMEGARVLLEAR